MGYGYISINAIIHKHVVENIKFFASVSLKYGRMEFIEYPHIRKYNIRRIIPPFKRTAKIKLCGPIAIELMWALYHSPSTYPYPHIGELGIIFRAASHKYVLCVNVKSLCKISSTKYLARSLFSKPRPLNTTKNWNRMKMISVVINRYFFNFAKGINVYKVKRIIILSDVMEPTMNKDAIAHIVVTI